MEKKTKDKGVEPSQKMRQSPTMDAVNTNGSEVVTNCDHLPQLSVESRILTIRDMQVILDRDLAELYGVQTARLNEQVNPTGDALRHSENGRFRGIWDTKSNLSLQNCGIGAFYLFPYMVTCKIVDFRQNSALRP